MARIWQNGFEEEKSFNIYLGTTPIKKIYLGSTEITNAIY